MGDQGAGKGISVGLFPDVFSRYGKLLARSVARLVRPQDVEDVVQETYIRVFQAAKKQPIRSPQAFMLKAARNIAFDRLARVDALNHIAGAPAESGDDCGDDRGRGDFGYETVRREELTPDRVLESEEEFVAFCRATRALPRQCRRAFLLRKVYGLSQREVALRLGVSEGTIEKHIAKAMFECLRYMQANGHMQQQNARYQGKRVGTAP
jgi:RNA polymerase sigma-70 factor (ECF subfamily)